MKKILMLLIVFLLCSCENLSIPEELCKITITVHTLGEGVPITRSSHEKIVSTIEHFMPTYYDLIFENVQNGNKYQVRTGTQIQIPKGRYHIYTSDSQKFFCISTNSWYEKDYSRDYSGNEYQLLWYGMGGRDSAAWTFGPSVIVDETVDVIQDGSLSLRGKIRSVVFVVENYSTLEAHYLTEFEPFKVGVISTDGMYLFYLDKPFTTKLRINGTIEYQIQESEVKSGYYYILPTDQSASTTFSVYTSDWSYGGSF